MAQVGMEAASLSAVLQALGSIARRCPLTAGVLGRGRWVVYQSGALLLSVWSLPSWVLLGADFGGLVLLVC